MKTILYLTAIVAAIALLYKLYKNAAKNEPSPVKKTVFGYCPYCGTQNAQITYYEKDGNIVITNVLCGNKSCPQHFKD